MLEVGKAETWREPDGALKLGQDTNRRLDKHRLGVSTLEYAVATHIYCLFMFVLLT